MKNRINALFKSIYTFDYLPRYSRLKGSLTTYEAELEFRVSSNNLKGTAWFIEADKLLKKTDEFLSDYKIDEAWKCFHTAQRHEIYGMSSQERLELSKALISECNKIKDWRAKAIKDILGNPESTNYVVPSADSVVQATKLKDEHYNNLYYQNRLTRSLYRLLFWLLAIVTGLLIWFSSCCITGSSELPEHSKMIEGVILFGLLGAITSSILFTRNQEANSRFSEIATNNFIVLSKIAVGVGFTVFIYFLLRSSFLDNLQVFSFTLSNDIDYYTIAFLSGFTERIAQKAMNLILGEKDVKAEKKE